MYVSGMYHGCIMIVTSLYLSCIMNVLEAVPHTSVFLHTLPITFLGPSLSGYPVLGISSPWVWLLLECGRKLPNRLPNFCLISCLIDCLIAISVLFGSEMPSEIAHRPLRWERAFPMVAAIAALQITLSQIRQTIRQTIRRKLGSRLGVFV